MKGFVARGSTAPPLPEIDAAGTIIAGLKSDSALQRNTALRQLRAFVRKIRREAAATVPPTSSSSSSATAATAAAAGAGAGGGDGGNNSNGNNNNEEELVANLMPQLLSMLEQEQAPPHWLESGFRSAKVLIGRRDDAEFRKQVMKVATANFEHDDARVRVAVSEVLKPIARRDGVEVYIGLKASLFDCIRRNMVRAKSAPGENLWESAAPFTGPLLGGGGAGGGAGGAEAFEGSEAGDISSCGTLSPRCESPRYFDNKGKVLQHDTEGWHALDSSFKCLRRLIAGCESRFEPLLDAELEELLESAAVHINRFVRETSFYTMATISNHVSGPRLAEWGQRGLAKLLARGLTDNWAHVTYSAAVAIRAFLTRVETPSNFFVAILPTLCLNRYNSAEGVRVHCLETWKMACGMEGPNIIAKQAEHFVDCYITQSTSENHALREAAVYVMGEMCVKINKRNVTPFVERILLAICDRRDDSSWTVREACVAALVQVVKPFPRAVRPHISTCVSIWCDRLGDPVLSVREHSALSMREAVEVFPTEVLAGVSAVLSSHLLSAEKQPSDVDHYGGGGIKLSTGGVAFGGDVKRARDNDSSVHTNQTTLSCCDLEPDSSAMVGQDDEAGGGLGSEQGGHDHHHHHHHHHGAIRGQPWCYSDGCLFLLREMCTFKGEIATDHLAQVAQLAGVLHFAQFHQMHDTLWRSVAAIARQLGADRFLPYAKAFVAPALCVINECGNDTAAAAAGYAMAQFRELLKDRFTSQLTEEQVAALRKSSYVTTVLSCEQ